MSSGIVEFDALKFSFDPTLFSFHILVLQVVKSSSIKINISKSDLKTCLSNQSHKLRYT